MAQSANPAFACPVTLMNGLFDVCSSFMIWLCVGGEKKENRLSLGEAKAVYGRSNSVRYLPRHLARAGFPVSLIAIIAIISAHIIRVLIASVAVHTGIHCY